MISIHSENFSDNQNIYFMTQKSIDLITKPHIRMSNMDTQIASIKLF